VGVHVRMHNVEVNVILTVMKFKRFDWYWFYMPGEPKLDVRYICAFDGTEIYWELNLRTER